MESDESYYRRRAVEEQVAAKKATCAAARERHEEMANMYRLRVESLTPNDVRQSPDVSSQPMSEAYDLLAD